MLAVGAPSEARECYLGQTMTADSKTCTCASTTASADTEGCPLHDANLVAFQSRIDHLDLEGQIRALTRERDGLMSERDALRAGEASRSSDLQRQLDDTRSALRPVADVQAVGAAGSIRVDERVWLDARELFYGPRVRPGQTWRWFGTLLDWPMLQERQYRFPPGAYRVANLIDRAALFLNEQDLAFLRDWWTRLERRQPRGDWGCVRRRQIYEAPPSERSGWEAVYEYEHRQYFTRAALMVRSAPDGSDIVFAMPLSIDDRSSTLDWELDG